VVVATVGGQASLAKELAQLADEVIEIPQDTTSPRSSPDLAAASRTKPATW
jgi:hypothetical protein